MHDGTYRPAGLWKDGPSTVYARFRVPAGTHVVTMRLRDSGRKSGFDYTSTERVALAAGENFVIDFHGTEGSFSFGQKRQAAVPARESE